MACNRETCSTTVLYYTRAVPSPPSDFSSYYSYSLSFFAYFSELPLLINRNAKESYTAHVIYMSSHPHAIIISIGARTFLHHPTLNISSRNMMRVAFFVWGHMSLLNSKENTQNHMNLCIHIFLLHRTYAACLF